MPIFFSQHELASLREGRPAAPPPDAHTLQWFAENRVPLFFFGAGGFGRLLAGLFIARGGVALGFFDNNPAVHGHIRPGDAKNDVPVLDPSLAAGLLARHTEARLLLTISTCDGQVEASRQAEDLGIRFEPFVTPYGHNVLAVDNPDPERVYEWLEDEQSKAVYKALVRRTCGLDPEAELPFEPDQYFPDFMPREAYRAFLDVGALDGDTFKRYLARFGDDFDAYYAVEPNPANVERFHRREHPKLTIFPVAASDREGVVKMIAAQSMSRIADNGGLEVRAAKLDDLPGCDRATFVKMDVEAWEPFALRGAERLIRERRPALAISIYHGTAHLWEVPILIKELCPEYRLAIRHHSRFMTETICYALP